MKIIKNINPYYGKTIIINGKNIKSSQRAGRFIETCQVILKKFNIDDKIFYSILEKKEGCITKNTVFQAFYEAMKNYSRAFIIKQECDLGFTEDDKPQHRILKVLDFISGDTLFALEYSKAIEKMGTDKPIHIKTKLNIWFYILFNNT